MKYFLPKPAVFLLVFLIFISGCFRFWSAQQRAVEHYVSALSHHVADRDAEALVELQAAVELDREFALAYSLLGDLHRQSGALTLAADAYENACRLDPGDFNDHFHLGQVYQWLERFSEAVGVLKQACRLRPDHVQAHYTLGVCYYETGQYEAAVEYCGKAARLAPDNHQIWASLGDIYRQTDDAEKAVAAFKQALEIDDRQVEVMIRLGSTYLDMQQFAPARLLFEKAIQTEPEQAQPYLALAYGLLVEGNHQITLEREQEAQQNPMQAKLHHQQALRFYRQALQQYRQAGRIDSSSYLAYNGMGVADMMLYINDSPDPNLRPQALEYWRRSLEIFADQPKIINLIEKYSK